MIFFCKKQKINKKLYFAITLLAFCIFFVPQIINAAQINFQPSINVPGFQETQVQGDTIAKYINAFYKWSVIAIAIFAVLMIVNAGFGMVLNSGNAANVTEKRDEVFRAIIGLLLVLITVPFLQMINPALVRLSNLAIAGISKVPDELPPVSDPSLVCKDNFQNDCGEVYRQTIEGHEIVCCGTKCPSGEGCASVTGSIPLGGTLCPPGNGDFIYRVCQKTNNPQCNGNDCSLGKKCDQTCCGGTKKVTCYCDKSEKCPCPECDPIQSCVGVMCE